MSSLEVAYYEAMQDMVAYTEKLLELLGIMTAAADTDYDTRYEIDEELLASVREAIAKGLIMNKQVRELDRPDDLG